MVGVSVVSLFFQGLLGLALLNNVIAQEGTCMYPPLSGSQCGFYPDCLESFKECGSHGYALGYGLKYCDLFTDNETQLCMDDPGNVWINSTLVCLQQALVPVIEGDPDNVTCPQIKSIAFSSHPICYTGGGGPIPTDPSICFLPPFSDWGCLLETISPKDLFSPRAVKQELETGVICLKQLGCERNNSDPRCEYWNNFGKVHHFFG